jgi:hypothetical protein
MLALAAATASLCRVMLGLVPRSMSARRSELSVKIGGLRTGPAVRIDGRRTEMNAESAACATR